ncbi:MAG: hypothetical protein KDD53_00310 [Bdellovibrionales bacterium]|nr:hypothetical protein [Bdellovibrionales bacterium]
MEVERFDGQHEEETVLYVIRPHPLKFFIACLFWTVVACGLAYGVEHVREFTSLLDAYEPYTFYGVILVIWAAILWYRKFVIDRERTYITDRRIVRFTITFPAFALKRSLLWSEVLKVKGYPSNLLMRILKIGQLQVFPTALKDEDVLIEYVFYFEDLVNYLDKILFLSRSNPKAVADLRPFVTRPKGKRYPMQEPA